MQKHYQRIVYGATFLGLGLAAADPENTLILEPSSLVGSEMIDALAFPENQLTEPQSEFGRQLQTELATRKVIVGQQLHLPNAAPSVMLLIQRFRLQIIFLTKVSSSESAAGQVTVDALCLNDLCTWTCDQFIDTTANLRLLQKLAVPIRAEIHALLRGSADDLHFSSQPGWIVRTGLYPRYMMLGLPIGVDDTPDQGRTAILAAMQSLPSTADVQLLAIANTPWRTLAYHVHQLGPGKYLAPSCGSKDLFDALNQADVLVHAVIGGAAQ